MGNVNTPGEFKEGSYLLLTLSTNRGLFAVVIPPGSHLCKQFVVYPLKFGKEKNKMKGLLL